MAETSFFKCHYLDEVSFITFLDIYNSFIISADASLTDGEIVYNNNGLTKTINATPSLLYKYDKWKCIIFDFRDSSEIDSTIKSFQYIILDSYVFEDGGNFNFCASTPFHTIEKDNLVTAFKILEDKRFNNIDVMSFLSFYKTFIKSKEYGK